MLEDYSSEKLQVTGDIVKHVHYTEVELEEPSEKGLKDIRVRWLISKKDGAENFAMRLFEIQPGGYSPLHQHNWEHEVFILEGNGVTQDKDNKNRSNKEMYYLFHLWNGINLLILEKRF